MLKKYIVNGLTYQFEEGKQPADAVEVAAAKPVEKVAEPEAKIAKPSNKGRKAETK